MDAKEARRRKILTEPLMPLLIKTSVPTIIGMLVSVIYNLTDTFFVGLLNNRSMTAAVGVVFSFVSVIQAIGFWYGYGSGNVMAKRIGEKNYKEAEIVSAVGIGLAAVSGLVIMIFAQVFILPLAGLIGGNASENVLTYTSQYLRLIILSIPFSLYGITLYNQLRLCGNVKDGMLGLLAGMLSNMALDPILMFGLGMGFLGAGYATLAGQVIGCVVLTWLAEKNGNIPVRLGKAKYKRERIYHILAGGMPNFSRQAITSAALVLLNAIAAQYGESMIAALTVSAKVAALAYMIMIGWGQGFQPICAMNYGAGQYDRVKKAFQLTVWTGTVFLILASAVLYVFAGQFIQMLSKNSEVVFIGIRILRMQCLTMPLLGFLAVSSMFMQNTGQYFWALLISSSRQGIFYIPLLYLLPALYGRLSICLIQPVSDFLSFILAVAVVGRRYAKIFEQGSLLSGQSGRAE